MLCWSTQIYVAQDVTYIKKNRADMGMFCSRDLVDFKGFSCR